jgi:hypothetical protein
MNVVGINGSGDIVGWARNRCSGGCSWGYNDGLRGSGWSRRGGSLNLRRRNNYWSRFGGRSSWSWWGRSRGRRCLGGLDRLDSDRGVEDNSLDRRGTWDGTLGDGDRDDVGDDISHDLSGVESLVDRRGDGQSSAEGCENN